jgi:hypothetical protein
MQESFCEARAAVARASMEMQVFRAVTLLTSLLWLRHIGRVAQDKMLL